MLVDGELILLGVSSKRHGYDWGTPFEIVPIGGYDHRAWIDANLDSIDTRISAWDVGVMFCPKFNGLYDQCMDTNVNDDGTLIFDVDGDPCSQYAHMPGFCGKYDTAEFRSVD